MKQYTIPITWEMYGLCNVMANSLEEAIAYALSPDCPLPDDGDYITASEKLDREMLYHYNRIE